jgi:hypothetical protein
MRPLTTSEPQGLEYLAVEISYGSRWISINDGQVYKISADQTRENSAKTWRKTTADSPILGGNYLVHAVPDMVLEQVGIWVRGVDQTEVSDNLFTLVELFEQYDYRIRWTLNEHREYWRCQLADSSLSRGQVWTHSRMALAQFQIPRYPNVTRERI